ncbi:MAG: lysophospholipid acyltransferase family protein [Castellaniella sp.]
MKLRTGSTVLHALFRHLGRLSWPRRHRRARLLAWLARHFMRSRVHVVRTNLRLCFPESTAAQREAWLKHHFLLLAQSVIDRGLLWFGPEADIRAGTPITGLEHLQALLDARRPVILLAPHMIGLDAAATRLTLFLKESATMYTPQSHPGIDALVRRGRGRFNTVHLVSRREGIRGLLAHLRRGVPVYYLPDMDFGRKGAIFVPFFGIPAATLPTTAQIARRWDAAVVPILSRLDAQTGQYHIRVLPPLADFPGEESLEDATARLNRKIEAWVREDPPQYYWVHRRFKTQPDISRPKPY